MSITDGLFVSPSTHRLRVMRDGRSIIRSARVPKPVVLVDTRERAPFPLYANHPNWIGGERRVALKTGDQPFQGSTYYFFLLASTLAVEI